MSHMFSVGGYAIIYFRYSLQDACAPGGMRPGLLPLQPPAKVTIVDSDGAPSALLLESSIANTTVDEDDATFPFAISLSRATNETESFGFQPIAGATATPNIHCRLVNETIAIPKASTTWNVGVRQTGSPPDTAAPSLFTGVAETRTFSIRAASRAVGRHGTRNQPPRDARHQEDAMARVTILYWQEIPSVVEARDRSGRHKIELSQRFQELIDLVAMKKKMVGTDEYLLQWNKGEPKEQEGDPEAVAESVAEDIEARYDAIRAEELAKCSA